MAEDRKVDAFAEEPATEAEGREITTIPRPVPLASDRGMYAALTIDEAHREFEKFKSFVSSQMQEGQDYGTMPGGNKPFLWLGGAEKIAKFHGVVPVVKKVAEEIREMSEAELDSLDAIEGNHLYYEVTYDGYIQRVSDGFIYGPLCRASCNSMESKYREARSNREKKRDEAIRNGWDKIPASITVYDQKHTIDMMSQKRGIVGAVRHGTAASMYFTQDEDLVTSQTDQVEITPETPIDFGKNKGMLLGDLELDYMEWCIDNLTSKPHWVDAFRKEIKRREDASMGYGEGVPGEGGAASSSEELLGFLEGALDTEWVTDEEKEKFRGIAGELKSEEVTQPRIDRLISQITHMEGIRRARGWVSPVEQFKKVPKAIEKMDELYRQYNDGELSEDEGEAFEEQLWSIRYNDKREKVKERARKILSEISEA